MQIISQINIHNLSYFKSDQTSILDELSLSLDRQKIGIVGDNGSGKSTLLRLIIKELLPTSGVIQTKGHIAYCPQRIVWAKQSVAEVLNIADKLFALKKIQSGSANVKYFDVIVDDWHVEARAKEMLVDFGLQHIDFDRCVSSLSGGEQTRLLLAGVFLSDADFLILDEPTNNLDAGSRRLLYEKIQSWKKGVIVASHDRQLLQLVEEIIELNSLGASVYGGNYTAYQQQKKVEEESALHDLNVAKLAMKKAKRSAQKAKEHHEQNQKKGRQNRRKRGQPKLVLGSRSERSEQTQSTILIREQRLMREANHFLAGARKKIEIKHEIDISLPDTKVPNHKLVLDVECVSFSYLSGKESLLNSINFQLRGPERVALMGKNGSGKTSLIKLLLGELIPSSGAINVGVERVCYVDQQANGLDESLTVLENFQERHAEYNDTEARRCLAHFLFRGDDVLKSVSVLSGGERLRALLACVFMSSHPPQLLILDEPTNHLDLQSVQSLEFALQCYQGAMLVVSHDAQFLKNIGVSRAINLSSALKIAGE